MNEEIYWHRWDYLLWKTFDLLKPGLKLNMMLRNNCIDGQLFLFFGTRLFYWKQFSILMFGNALSPLQIGFDMSNIFVKQCSELEHGIILQMWNTLQITSHRSSLSLIHSFYKQK